MPASKRKQPAAAAANKPPKEKPLDTFIPTSYMALLEGTLLTNGDLKGSWRLRREDVVKNDFCMVLMDRGVYDGGFNIQVAKAHPSAPAVQEIHDKWYSVEWAETTKTCCNVWGRGRNKEFGEFFTIGVHDPRQRRIVIYKVCEAEMRRAQAFARSNAPGVKPDPAGAVVSAAASPAATTRAAAAAAAAATAAAAAAAVTAPPAAAPALPVAATAVAPAATAPLSGVAAQSAATTPLPTAAATAAASAASAAAAAAAVTPTRQKRPRTYSRVGEITAAAALLYSAAHAGPQRSSGGGGGGSSSNYSAPTSSYPSADAHRSSSDGDAGGGGGGSGRGDRLGGDQICVEGSGGGPAVGESPASSVPVRATPAAPAHNVHAHTPATPAHNVHAHKAYTHTGGNGAAGYRPTPVHIPAEATRTLPGFSGVFEEPSKSRVGVVDGGVDDLADLSILGARLQREKLRIQEDARAQRQPYVEQMSEFQGKLRKAKADEAMMLRAVQELRKKMMEDERQLESATQRVKSYEAEEQHALLLWNNKWETQVAPFIAQCEQGVKKKADELDKKTREAEMERRKLERELERLRSVKQIGDVFAQNLPR